MKNSLSGELLADESLDDRILRILRAAGLTVHSIREDRPGMSDRDVLDLSCRLNSLLLTEDSDFGTWVFAHKVPTVGIFYLRYRPGEHEQIARVLVDVVRKEGDSLRGKYVTLTPRKTRFRDI